MGRHCRRCVSLFLCILRSRIQRADDVPETVAARLETYYKNTKPLIDFYEGRGLIVEGDNGKSSEDCLKQIEEGLKVKGLI